MSKFGGGGGGAAAAAGQRQLDEEKRQARLAAGMAGINDSFAGFDDAFFDGRRSAYESYYLPQLDDEFTRDRESLVHALADAGQLKSTAANDAFADLTKQYQLQQGTIKNQAQGAAADYRAQVGRERDALVTRLQASEDPDIASASAIASARALRDNVPNFSPLADVLSPVLVAGANFARTKKNADLLQQAGLTAPDPRAGGGTFRVG